MGMEGLGYLFNVIPTAQGRSVSLKNAAGVTFVCYGANEVFTLNSQPTAGGSATALATISRYQQSSTATGANVWVEETQSAASTVTPPSSGMVAFYVDAADLPSGADYVEVVHTSSGLVVAIVHGLLDQRDPASLPALSV
jgi:hypothetical protein